MPVEIKELIVRTTVATDATPSVAPESSSTLRSSDHESIVRESVRQVLRSYRKSASDRSTTFQTLFILC